VQLVGAGQEVRCVRTSMSVMPSGIFRAKPPTENRPLLESRDVQNGHGDIWLNSFMAVPARGAVPQAFQEWSCDL